MGTWIVRGAPLTDPTGATDLTDPNFAFVIGASAGTAKIPIFDSASAFVYLDGSGTPVDIAGLPSGFTPDDAFTMHHVTAAINASDSVELAISGLLDETFVGPIGLTPPFFTETPLTGMTLTKFEALLSAFVLVTLTSGGAPGAEAGEQNTDPYDADNSFSLQGTYTAGSISAVSPDTGPVAGGTVITITGSGFTGATAVNFINGLSSSPASGLVVVDDTTITCVTPPCLFAAGSFIFGPYDVEVVV